MSETVIKLRINDKPYTFVVTPQDTLLDIIRDEAGLKGTKKGCGMGQCGACTVILNKRAVNSCCILALQADGGEIYTIESLQEGRSLHPIQEAYVEEGAIQCGFCTPGMIMSTKALLDRNPIPEDTEIREALSGNICRCTGYTKIENAVKSAAQKINGEKTEENV